MVPSNGTRGFALFSSQASSQTSTSPAGPANTQPSSVAQALPPGDAERVRTEVAPATNWLDEAEAWAGRPWTQEEAQLRSVEPYPPIEKVAVAAVVRLIRWFSGPPPETPGSDGPRGARVTADETPSSLFAPLVKSGAYYGAAVGGPFGLATTAAARLRIACPSPAVRVLSQILPLAAGGATPYIESWLSKATGYEPTRPDAPNLAFDAINPVGIFAMILAYNRMPSSVPRPPITTLPGASMAVLSAMAGSTVGGAVAEWAAQNFLPPRTETHKTAVEAPDGTLVVSTGAKSAGRVAALLPYAAAGALKPLSPLQAAGAATGGWVFRNWWATWFATIAQQSPRVTAVPSASERQISSASRVAS